MHKLGRQNSIKAVILCSAMGIGACGGVQSQTANPNLQEQTPNTQAYPDQTPPNQEPTTFQAPNEQFPNRQTDQKPTNGQTDQIPEVSTEPTQQQPPALQDAQVQDAPVQDAPVQTPREPCVVGSVTQVPNDQNVPEDYTQADGRVVQIEDNVQLFEVVGDQFGGDGLQTFGLPSVQAPDAQTQVSVVCVKGTKPTQQQNEQQHTYVPNQASQQDPI